MNNELTLETPVWQHGTPPNLISGRICVIWYMDDYEFGMWSAPHQIWWVLKGDEWHLAKGKVEKWCLLPRGKE